MEKKAEIITKEQVVTPALPGFDYQTPQALDYSRLILNHMLYGSSNDYEQIVTHRLNSFPKIPSSFATIQEYAQTLRLGIELSSHMQIVQGLKSMKHKRIEIAFQNVIAKAPKPIGVDIFEYQLEVKLDPEQLNPAIKSHLPSSVFLLKNRDIPQVSFLCLSTSISTRSSASSFLTLSFSSQDIASTRKLFCEAPAQRWYAIYVTSLLDCSRNHHASFQLAQNRCIESIVTGNIPNIRRIEHAKSDYSLNEYQYQLIDCALHDNDNHTIILHGPPGTGKTEALTKLIGEAARQGHRVLVTAPSNLALGELAKRVTKIVPNRTILLGLGHKLPQELKIHFLQDCHLRLTTSLNDLYRLTYAIKINEQSQDFYPLINTLVTGLNQFIEQLKLYHDLSAAHVIELENYQSRFAEIQIKPDDKVLLSELTNAWFKEIKAIQKKISKMSQASVELGLLNQDGTVYFGTPSTVARTRFEKPFYMIIIEEAGRVSEMSCLPMFANNTEKLVIIGDPQQLEPQALSKKTEELQLNRSILKRLTVDLPAPYILLRIQYRMVDDLCIWPSKMFYKQQLITAPEFIPISYNYSGLNRPLVFCNLASREQKRNLGFVNIDEANLVMTCIDKLRDESPNLSIGVICFYAEQLNVIRDLLSTKKVDKVEAVTGDASQGREFDIVIVAGTRSNTPGFLADYRRINVTFTRAKHTMIVIANATLFRTFDVGKSFIDDIQARSSVVRKIFYTQDEFEELLVQKNCKIKSPTPIQNSLIQEKTVQEDDLNLAWAQKIMSLLNRSKDLEENMSARGLDDYDLSSFQEKLTALTVSLADEKKALEAIEDKIARDKSQKVSKNIKHASPIALLSHSQKAEPELEQKNQLNRLVNKNRKDQRTFQMTAFEASRSLFSSLKNKDNVKRIAFSTYDPSLRAAACLRLAYEAFGNALYWEALFYIQNVMIQAPPEGLLNHIACTPMAPDDAFTVVESELEFNYSVNFDAKFYKNATLELYAQCIEQLIENKELPSDILSFTQIKWAELLSPSTPTTSFRTAVIATWCIEEIPNFLDTHLVALKLRMIEQLYIIYSQLLYGYKVEVQFVYLTQILLNLSARSSCFFDNEESIKKATKNVLNLGEKLGNRTKEILSKHKNNDSITLPDAFLANILKNTQYHVNSLFTEKDDYAERSKLKQDWIESSISEHQELLRAHQDSPGFLFIEYMLICCNLMNFYIKKNDLSSARLLFEQCTVKQTKHQDGTDSADYFLFMWFKFIYAQFWLLSPAEDKQKAQELLQELSSGSSTLFEVDFFLNAHDYRTKILQSMFSGKDSSSEYQQPKVSDNSMFRPVETSVRSNITHSNTTGAGILNPKKQKASNDHFSFEKC